MPANGRWDLIRRLKVNTLISYSMDLKRPGACPKNVMNNSFGYKYFVEFQQQGRVF